MADVNTTAERKLLLSAFRIIVVLATLTTCASVTLVWLWPQYATRSAATGSERMIMRIADGNAIQTMYPSVDFAKVYPDLQPAQIDALQRETLSVRYRYAPFVQFEPIPLKGRFIEITERGYRKGRNEQPWPPRAADIEVFVFGGSTTMGYGVRSENTVVAALQDELARLITNRHVECYNFGRGYYFSSQERVLFEQLLLDGIIPDMAIFIDGLNDFYYWDGSPQLTESLGRYLAPDLPRPESAKIELEADASAAVDTLLGRYKQNVKMIEGISQRFGVKVMFVGQPIPFMDLPQNKQTYPFPRPHAGHELSDWGYSRFRQWAEKGEFGPNFIWCGDVFKAATSIMYVDGLHYSHEGATVLARSIVRRAKDRALLPDGPPPH